MAKVKLPDSAYIFSPNVDGAGPIHPDSVSQAFRRITRRMEEPALAKLREEKPKATRANLAAADRWDFRLHDLRHYTATQYRGRAEPEDRRRTARARRPVGHAAGVHGQHQCAGAGGGRFVGGRAGIAADGPQVAGWTMNRRGDQCRWTYTGGQ